MSKALERSRDFNFMISASDVWQVAAGSEQELAEAMKTDSDRAVAIVGAALVEDRLADGLERFMRPDKKTFERLTDFTGPLGSFSQKSSMAYMLGLVSKMAFEDLEVMRKIRNKFAHSLAIASFETPVIKSKLNSLQLYRSHVVERSIEPNAFVVSLVPAIPRFSAENYSELAKLPRQRFLWTVQLFLIAFGTINFKENLPKI